MEKRKDHPEGLVLRMENGELHFFSAEVLASTRITDRGVKTSLEELASRAASAKESPTVQSAQVLRVVTNYDTDNNRIQAIDPRKVKLEPGRPIMLW
jgi:hypothetical protein